MAMTRRGVDSLEASEKLLDYFGMTINIPAHPATALTEPRKDNTT